jgi:hypothetical protein
VVDDLDVVASKYPLGERSQRHERAMPVAAVDRRAYILRAVD